MQLGALAACLLVGSLNAPIAERLRLPFGACAFAYVVSLIPGVFMFQAASDAIAFTGLGLKAPASMLVDLLDNVVTAGLVLSAMGTGLVDPKMILNALWPVTHRPSAAGLDALAREWMARILRIADAIRSQLSHDEHDLLRAATVILNRLAAGSGTLSSSR